MTPQEAIKKAFCIHADSCFASHDCAGKCERDSTSDADAAARAAMRALDAAGFITVPKPVAIGSLGDGYITLEYEPTEANKIMAREVAAKLFD